MKRLSLFIFVTAFLFSSFLFAQDQPEVSVETMEICAGVQDRQPMGVDSVFSSDVGQVYCFTQLTSSQDTTEISHVWFYNDKQMAKVDLTMGAKSWRTWSSKRIMPSWTGNWRVEVQAASGAGIASKSFRVE
jgi:hypothetical protein